MSLTVSSLNSTGSSVSTLFSSLSTSSSSTGLESILSDYSSIKSGSYSKLLKAYYSKVDSSSTSDSSSSTKAATSEYTKVKSSADSLSKAADTLLDKTSSSVWEMTTTTDEDGNETTDYDRDKIYNALSSFIDSYNSLVDEGEDSSSTGILTQVASMVTSSAKASSTLAQVGITIGSNNHLSIDEDFFKNNADMTVAKDLFSGTGSYAYQVKTKASMVSSYANSSLSEITGSKAYNSSGSYTISASEALSTLNTTV